MGFGVLGPGTSPIGSGPQFCAICRCWRVQSSHKDLICIKKLVPSVCFDFLVSSLTAGGSSNTGCMMLVLYGDVWKATYGKRKKCAQTNLAWAWRCLGPGRPGPAGLGRVRLPYSKHAHKSGLRIPLIYIGTCRIQVIANSAKNIGYYINEYNIM